MKVTIQRDELRMALCDLYDSIVHGIHNGILTDKSDGANCNDPKSKCKKGHLRSDVLWRMGACCTDCDGIGQCHLSFEEKDLFEAMREAMEVARKPPAEMPHVAPSDFQKYVAYEKHDLDPVSIARQLYRFCVGYWCYSDHYDMKLEKEWERAFNDLLCISLDSIGRDGASFRKFVEMAEKDDIDDEGKAFVEGHPQIGRIVDDAVKSRGSSVKGPEDIENLVMHAVLIRMDYKFAHDYPGADMGIYGDVFSFIIDGCLAVAGLSPDDRPVSYNFDDESEHKRKLLEYEANRKIELFKFMEPESVS